MTLPDSCHRKVRHETLLDALRAIASMRAKGRRGILRAYRCNKCRRYHLTSRPRTWGGKQWHVGCA